MISKFQNLVLLLKTIGYLNFTQITYQIYYRLKSKFIGYPTLNKKYKRPLVLNWTDIIYYKKTFFKNNTFKFLNKKKEFREINWNILEFKKLWVYNLNYFDFLNQEKISKKQGLCLIKNYISNYSSNFIGKEPYPTSLRIINWIKFVSKHKIKSKSVFNTIYMDTLRLNKNIEYHIQGNHLLENSFALLFSGIFFNNIKMINKSSRLLRQELQIQILEDGCHFELSPMYHNILLRKIFDCIHFINLNNIKLDIQSLLINTSSRMLGFIKALSYDNGEFPLFNDSSKTIALNYKDLHNYAKRIGINEKDMVLSESGYRKWNFNDLEVRIDIGKIGPKFLTAHSHADTFSFELMYGGNKIVVDPGISTYHNLKKREKERSTMMHNTININYKNSSQVWSFFRTADRANVKIIEDSEKIISAYHDGYKSEKCITKRTFSRAPFELIIDDEVISNKNQYIESNIHFYPGIDVNINNNKIISKKFEIRLKGYKNLKLSTYNYPLGFNKYVESYKLTSQIENNSNISFKFH